MPSPSDKPRTLDADAIRAFFDQWRIYREFVDANCLHHREVGRLLRQQLADAGPHIRLLDLACGDASLTSAALRGLGASLYVGVDFCRPALDLASQQISGLADTTRLIEDDFMDYLGTSNETFDVIYIGLSMHHLQPDGKTEFLRRAKRMLAPQGSLLCFEPMLRQGENRAEFLTAWKNHIDNTWTAVSPASREVIWQHVRECDFPATAEFLASASRSAGFHDFEEIFTSDDKFYSLLAFRS